MLQLLSVQAALIIESRGCFPMNGLGRKNIKWPKNILFYIFVEIYLFFIVAFLVNFVHGDINISRSR